MRLEDIYLLLPWTRLKALQYQETGRYNNWSLRVEDICIHFELYGWAWFNLGKDQVNLLVNQQSQIRRTSISISPIKSGDQLTSKPQTLLSVTRDLGNILLQKHYLLQIKQDWTHTLGMCKHLAAVVLTEITC